MSDAFFQLKPRVSKSKLINFHTLGTGNGGWHTLAEVFVGWEPSLNQEEALSNNGTYYVCMVELSTMDDKLERLGHHEYWETAWRHEARQIADSVKNNSRQRMLRVFQRSPQ